MNSGTFEAERHDHIFLGVGHETNARKTWGVIVLCGVMMVVEIVGGSIFGSLALVADGLHMSTHAGAMLIAALAYTYARRHASDSRFVFGTGKLGDLAGFTSAIVLAMTALLIGYEAVSRFLSPVAIHFREAIPIAVVGLIVNIVSAWLLSGHEHQGHDHSHSGDHDPHNHSAGAAHRDNSIRSAYVHVIADAIVSVLAITGLVFARTFGWLWMDPLAGIVGACVIANWSYGLLRDTGRILLDVCPDAVTAETLRQTIERDGDEVKDLHLWRLGPGHLGAIICVATGKPRSARFYRELLQPYKTLSHVTVEVTTLAG
ncbi:MAG TPA: CDF family Co(II)/Ni(II) efflux transporter DmeF [Steroidobacteraceae bacterium]|jgi:cation diffusion facilitator family transporter|nr:CDF family Co(II)/Ni(II) efflux transporter DmeF [Steroidobacteraceae bacterium]